MSRTSTTVRSTIVDALIACLMAGGLLLLAALRMRSASFGFDWAAARAGIATVVADTGRAAVVSGLVVGTAVAIIARWLRRSGAYDHSEAAAGALVCLWAAAYVALLALGPLGWYHPVALRGALAVVLVAMLVGGAGTPAPARHRPGRLVAVLAFAMLAPAIAALQLGSPVSPFMDVLPYIASVQKIVTFRYYDAFANDAAGLWAPTRQVSGSDAFFSWVSLVVGVPASLGITSLMVVLCGFQLLGIYLLGKAVGGSLTGGFAAMLVLQTFVWRRTADARGTALAFALVAVGLALLLRGHRGRRPGKAALGAASLGISVTVNPLIGALGLIVAGLTAVVEMIDRRRGLVLFASVFAGAVVLALPQVGIGLARAVPLWAPALVAGSGAVLLAAIARLRIRGRGRPAGTAWANLVVTALLPAFALFWHARRQSEFFGDDWHDYAVLMILGGLGLVAGAAIAWRDRRRTPATVAALALWIGIAAHAVADPLRFQGTLETRSLASEVTTKMIYYWTPYWLALAGAVLFATLARRLGRVPALAMALMLTVYPVRQVREMLDYDAGGLSVAENVAFDVTNAARGYFSGYPDRRWVTDGHWDVVNAALRAEIDAGRIDYYTHVLHVTQSTGIEAALATGVSVDLVTPRYDANSIWTVGGRSRAIEDVPSLLAARPPYVLLEEYPPERFGGLLDYERIAAAPRLQLFRLRR